MQDLRAPKGMWTVWHYDDRTKEYLWSADYINVVRAMQAAMDHNSYPEQSTKALVVTDTGRVVEVFSPQQLMEMK